MRETIQNANGKQFHAVSLSGGKDSTAMLLLMIERDMPINMVLSADTGMEFPEMYEHLAKLDEHLFRERGIHITTLRHPKGFEYLMFDEPKQKPRSLENRAKLGIPPYGNGWPGIRVRWCTGQLKTHLITKEVNRLKVKTKVLFNLTKRQLICFGSGALIGVPLFFLLKGSIGTSPAAMVMMVVMIPAMLFAMYEKNGQPLEVVIRNIYRVCFQRPKQRPYKTNNFYAVLERQNQLDREVYQIVRKEKADPRRTKTDRNRHRKSEPNG